jgi:XapX domain-containing protein
MQIMKFLIGAVIAFLIGAVCRYFDIPVPSPPVLPGALLVVAMTLGYTATNYVMRPRTAVATAKDLSNGPSGQMIAKQKGKE